MIVVWNHREETVGDTTYYIHEKPGICATESPKGVINEVCVLFQGDLLDVTDECDCYGFDLSKIEINVSRFL